MATWEKAFLYYMLKREEFLKYYHPRPNVETAFMMMKTKFGDSISPTSCGGKQGRAIRPPLLQAVLIPPELAYSINYYRPAGVVESYAISVQFSRVIENAGFTRDYGASRVKGARQ